MICDAAVAVNAATGGGGCCVCLCIIDALLPFRSRALAHWKRGRWFSLSYVHTDPRVLCSRCSRTPSRCCCCCRRRTFFVLLFPAVHSKQHHHARSVKIATKGYVFFCLLLQRTIHGTCKSSGRWITYIHQTTFRAKSPRPTRGAAPYHTLFSLLLFTHPLAWKMHSISIRVKRRLVSYLHLFLRKRAS